MNPHKQPASKTRQTLIIIILTALLSAACALVPAAQLSPPETASTGLTATATAAGTKLAATAVPTEYAAAATATGRARATASTSGSQQPTPRPPKNPPSKPGNNNASATPTATKRASGGQAAADTTAPVIASAGSAESQAYYNDASCGTTAVTIRAAVTDNSGSVDQVWVNYLFAGGPSGGNWQQANLSPVGGGQYEVVINIIQKAANDLQGSDGVMQYQVFAQDAAGNAHSLPEGHPYGVDILSCGVLSVPPAGGGAIVISNIQLYPDPNTIYYGQCANEPTLLTVQVAIEPLDQIASAKLFYTYANAMGASPTYNVPMFQLGIGEYAGDIDTAVNAADTMGTENGNIDFYIQVEDINGATTDSPLMGMNVEYCPGVAALPPAAQLPDIRYFTGPNSVLAGETILLEWEVWDACKVFLDGNEVNAADNYAYTVPGNESDTTYTHTLAAWGSPCDNGTETTAQVNVQIQSSGSGAGTVSFINNSSHPIISLVIDGVEMFPNEPLGILSGDAENVTVSDGAHSFTAANGWWEFGSRNTMYNFSGTFTAQDGNVVFNNPTIAELLTNWGGSRYFQSSYMGDDGTFHFVGFCFYPDGTFREFDNGSEVDSGTYSETTRGGSTITTRLTGQSISVDALYYETFALLDVPRGNVADEYAPDDTAVCP